MTGPIVFDGSVLAAGPTTGVGRSLLTALEAYARIATRPLVLLLPHTAPAPGLRGIATETVRGGGLDRRLRWPGLLRQLDAALLHSPVAALPRHCPCPCIATVHDLPWRAPEPLREPGCGWRHRRAVDIALQRAAAIVVPSNATRRDLEAEARGRARARIVVVPHGIPAPLAPEPEQRDPRGPFVVLGDARPRKNLDRVRAAQQIGARMQRDLPSLELLGPGFRWVTEAEKSARLRAARALLHVSLFEGFGLPVVEGFVHEVPVLCSDRGSLPEIAGDAALLVEPTDVDAIARAMVRIHVDEALRARLVAAGRRRAAEFTPDAVAAAWRSLHAELAP